jgi:hypothetical protein
MQNLAKDPSRVVDLSISEGCPLCAGPIALRLSQKGARSCCRNCRWISEPLVRPGDEGLQVEYPPGLVA